MPRIKDEDVALVRERAHIDEVVREYVTLRNAGGGSLKGLCPFHDEKSPSFHVTPSRGFWHCLAGETRVVTRRGVRPIRDLAGGVHEVLGSGGRWVRAPFRSYGRQSLLAITLRRNGQEKVIRATDEHRWFVRSGRPGTSRREVLTKDLRGGHRLVSTPPRSRITRTTPSPFGIAAGIVFGAGTRSGSGLVLAVSPGADEQLLKYFPLSHTTYDGGRTYVHDLPRSFQELPDIDESVPFLAGWLAGYFAAVGYVAEDGTVVLDPATRQHLEFVRMLCTRLGIGTLGITSRSREGIPGHESSESWRLHLVDDDLAEAFFVLDEHRLRFSSRTRSVAEREWVVVDVQETGQVEEVFCAEVEDGHAFVLEDDILTGNCFGCGEGGDVISFVQKIDHIGFQESVERLADKVGLQLRYEDAGPAGGQQSRLREQRSRLVDGHRAAAEFYTEQLGASQDAVAGRQFLAERGFDKAAAEHFGVGYAPRDGDALTRHLRGLNRFSDEDLVAAGLSAQGRSGLYDRFRGRLVWPIRDLMGDVVGFGARRLYDDDRIEAKYLNTPETSIYKKSNVLYGVDLAKKEIAKRSQAVVVEGYTDVMACHLAGVTTAVATCGTAFGDEHAKILRRLLMDQDEYRGEVIFTFDGDAAGQKAAMRAFEGDQRFVAQTYVAVEPDGLDPCEVRQRKGDAAVRELVARRQPLFHFALRTMLREFDLDSAEGRTRALDRGIPVVARIRDSALRDEYARRLAGWVGAPDELAVVRRVRGAGGAPVDRRGGGRPAPPAQGQQALGIPVHGDVDPQTLSVEREALKVALQRPALAGAFFDELAADAFRSPAHQGVHAAIAAAGGCAGAPAGPAFVDAVLAAAADDSVRALVRELSVDAVPAREDQVPRYVSGMLARVHEMSLNRTVVSVKARLQRTDPTAETSTYNRLFGELTALEARRQVLRARAAEGL